MKKLLLLSALLVGCDEKPKSITTSSPAPTKPAKVATYTNSMVDMLALYAKDKEGFTSKRVGKVHTLTGLVLSLHEKTDKMPSSVSLAASTDWQSEGLAMCYFAVQPAIPTIYEARIEWQVKGRLEAIETRPNGEPMFLLSGCTIEKVK